MPAPQLISGATPISGAAGLMPGRGAHGPPPVAWIDRRSRPAAVGGVGGAVPGGAGGGLDGGGLAVLVGTWGPTVMSSTAASLAASTRVAEPSAPVVGLRTSTHVGLRCVDVGESVPALRVGDGALRGLRRVLRGPEQDHLDAAQRARRLRSVTVPVIDAGGISTGLKASAGRPPR